MLRWSTRRRCSSISAASPEASRPRTWSGSERGRGTVLSSGRGGRLDRLTRGRLRRVQSADRVTLGLAALTASTAGTVAAGEFARRLARRRAAAAPTGTDDGGGGAVLPEGPLEVLQLA